MLISTERQREAWTTSKENRDLVRLYFKQAPLVAWEEGALKGMRAALSRVSRACARLDVGAEGEGYTVLGF